MLRDIIIYSPVFVAFLWTIVLLTSSPKRNKAKFFLGVFMFAVFLLFLSHAFHFQKRVTIYWYFDLVFILCALCVYPLYYCYIKLLTVETTLSIKNVRMFLPAFILFGISTIDYSLMTAPQRYLYVSEVLFGGRNIANADLLIRIQQLIVYLVPVIYILQIFYTVTKSRKYIKTYNKTIANFYSNSYDKTIDWAIPIINSLVVASIISVVCSLLGRAFFLEETWLFYVPMICFSIIFFFAGYLGNIQIHSVANIEQETLFVTETITEYETIAPMPQELFNSTELKEALLQLFENDHIYTNYDLKIVDIANRLNTNRTYVSSVINNDLSSTFTKFVNQYRIQKAKELFQEDTSKQYTLEFVSQQVGFGSLHTFIRVFKEVEGVTPGTFRDKEL